MIKILKTGINVDKVVQQLKKYPQDWDHQKNLKDCLLYTSPSPRDVEESRMPSSA